MDKFSDFLMFWRGFAQHKSALNRRKKDTLGDGSRWEYAYDQLGQLTNAVKFDVGGATSLNNRFSYTADGIGNVLSAQSPTVAAGRVLARRAAGN